MYTDPKDVIVMLEKDGSTRQKFEKTLLRRLPAATAAFSKAEGLDDKKKTIKYLGHTFMLDGDTLLYNYNGRFVEVNTMSYETACSMGIADILECVVCNLKDRAYTHAIAQDQEINGCSAVVITAVFAVILLVIVSFNIAACTGFVL